MGIWQAVRPGSQRTEFNDFTDVLFYSASYDKGGSGVGFGESVFVQCKGKGITETGKIVRSVEDRDRIGIVLERTRFSDTLDQQEYSYPMIDFADPWAIPPICPLMKRSDSFIETICGII